MHFTVKTMVLVVGLIGVLFLTPGLARASSVSAVIDQVDQEYAAGQMDQATHDDLVLTLSKADGAGSEQHQAAVEAFNLLVTVYSGSSLNAAAAGRISTAAEGL